MELEALNCDNPYSLDRVAKEEFLNVTLLKLTLHHYSSCFPYKQMLDAKGFDIAKIKSYHDLPFLPTRLFKEMDLRSVEPEAVIKTMTSSGTSGQAVSRIYLDRDTAALQTKVLTRIVSDFIGKKRLPMIILDSAEVVKNRDLFSARGAGILGFSILGNKRIYALDKEMIIDDDGIHAFIESQAGCPILIFGFTFIVWQHFVRELERTGFHPDLSKATLIHGGGFKKLIDQAVSRDEFKASLNRVCGIEPKNVHDYYGMVEQTGSIHMECEYGHLHTSNYSDVIIRRVDDFSPAIKGERGIVQVLSVLPLSYPGHSLITEDEGAWLGEDDCPCGRRGRYFHIFGRLQSAEIRGCSDTYSSTVK